MQPTNPLDQFNQAPTNAIRSQAPKNTNHMLTPGSTSSQLGSNFTIWPITKAGRAIYTTHQFKDCDNPSGCFTRAVIMPAATQKTIMANAFTGISHNKKQESYCRPATLTGAKLFKVAQRKRHRQNRASSFPKP